MSIEIIAEVFIITLIGGLLGNLISRAITNRMDRKKRDANGK